MQWLKPVDHSVCRQFANYFILEEGDGFSEKLIFSDGAHVHFSGYVNKKNCRIWAPETPRVIVEKHLHSTRLII